MENLDRACAELGQKLSEHKEVDERLLADALSVLEGHGVYAAFLFLEARGEPFGKKLVQEMAEFLRKTPKSAPILGSDSSKSSENRDVFAELRELADDLDQLLFAHQLLVRALTYALYHAKARKADRG